ncbi:hypothetical protein L249_0870 [Ophiocordyceps polyrhachis-furcata BCC 54312]|uniref:Major facilitator superfamily (MFS) profile domain-containing protein n=1 Tax=Ophiocordyceps polyrhachis-furcata BCC 54312 TaxID=1330021 RepID=A0A367LE29_9HYPO|nr:hypothetical protein L249_0870 [Ophiocordyceps polyrhachis-furcata BCC 54312]
MYGQKVAAVFALMALSVTALPVADASTSDEAWKFHTKDRRDMADEAWRFHSAEKRDKADEAWKFATHKDKRDTADESWKFHTTEKRDVADEAWKFSTGIVITRTALSVSHHSSPKTPMATTEQRPLLPDQTHEQALFRRRVVAMCVLFLIVVELSSSVMEPSQLQIMEDVICRRHFPLVDDGRCKDNSVQKTLAMVRSWSMSADMLIPLVVQVPFGIVADKYGRRMVLSLSFAGCVLQTWWTMLVLLFPQVFSVWAILYGSIAFAVGGGSQMGGAMIWTIVADVTPVTDRTTVFYRLHSLSLILAVVINPLAALLLSISPWIGMWLGLVTLLVGVLVIYMIPETLTLDNDDDQHVLPMPVKGSCAAFAAARKHLGHVGRFVLASRSIVALISAYGLSIPASLSIQLYILQYMTRRFGWEWSTATYVSTVSSITSVIVLLVILPSVSRMLIERCAYSTLHRDLFLSRVSSAVIVVGVSILAFAPVPWLLVSSLVISSFGAGFVVLLRALLNALVEPQAAATVNTTISVVETLFSLAGAPALGWLLSSGLEAGGPWLGLPFLVSAGCSAMAFLALSVPRLPAGK